MCVGVGVVTGAWWSVDTFFKIINSLKAHIEIGPTHKETDSPNIMLLCERAQV